MTASASAALTVSAATAPLTMQQLALLDSIRTQLTLEADLDPGDVAAGLEARLIRRVTPVKEGDPTLISLTALGLEAAFAARSTGLPLLQMDITRYGLRIQEDLTEETWTALMMKLKLIKDTFRTTIADLLSYGRNRFGEDFVNDTVEQLEFSFEDITQANAIGKVPLALRQGYQLTSEHSYVLGLAFPDDPTSQDLWASRAREHHLSALALKRSIERGEIITDEALKGETGSGSGIPVINGLGLQFSRWQNHIGGEEKVLTMSEPARRQILREISPIAALCRRIELSLTPSMEAATSA